MATALNYNPNKRIADQTNERTPVGDIPKTEVQNLEASSEISASEKSVDRFLITGRGQRLSLMRVLRAVLGEGLEELLYRLPQ